MAKSTPSKPKGKTTPAKKSPSKAKTPSCSAKAKATPKSKSTPKSKGTPKSTRRKKMPSKPKGKTTPAKKSPSKAKTPSSPAKAKATPKSKSTPKSKGTPKSTRRKKRAAEILDEKLFQPLPPRDECPICLLTMPFHSAQITYNSCCGKVTCFGCSHAEVVKMIQEIGEVGPSSITLSPPCPFCRSPPPDSIEELNERLEQRMTKNDTNAYVQMAANYSEGDCGIPLDHGKAFELYTRAAELGALEAQYELGNIYRNGIGKNVNLKKARYHYELGAMGGCPMSRTNLAALDLDEGNYSRAMRHFKIVAGQGCARGLQGLQHGLLRWLITSEEFEEANRAFQAAEEEMKSEMREEAARHIADEGDNVYYTD